ncbi:MAG: hypothetical protein M1457_07340, partial [bacterium]|nr:hypothetical protein [bacterium]
MRLAHFKWRLYPERIEFGYPTPSEIRHDFVADRDLLWVTKDYAANRSWMRKYRPEVVFMGCSCTEYSEYPDLVMKRIDARLGKYVDYINMAVAGWSTAQGLVQLRRDILPCKPRVVTIYYGWNDHWIGFGITDREAVRIN